jgi:hypothetical protein
MWQQQAARLFELCARRSLRVRARGFWLLHAVAPDLGSTLGAVLGSLPLPDSL